MCCLLQLHAQQNPTIAKLKYQGAEEAFLQSKYLECLTQLDEAETALGKTNPPIEHLRILAYEKNYEKALNRSDLFSYTRTFDHLAYLQHKTDAFIKKYGSDAKLEDRLRDVLKVQDKYRSQFDKISSEEYARLHKLLQAAFQNDANAMYKVAKYYDDTIRSSADKYWYIKASEKGHLDAMACVLEATRYSFKYLDVDGYERKQAQAFIVASFKKAYAKQHPEALLTYGKLLSDPDDYSNKDVAEYMGIQKDTIQALKLMQQAAAKGLHRANKEIAKEYYFGGFAKNYAKALEYFNKAASLGVPSIYSFIGYVYSIGDDTVPQDGKKAIEYFNKQLALAPGDRNSLFGIAEIYRKGIAGVDKNYTKAVEWYTKSIDLKERATDYHNQYSNLRMAEMYFTGGYGLQVDYQKAFNLFFDIYKSEEMESSFAKAKAGFYLGETYYTKFLNNAISKDNKDAMAESMVMVYTSAAKNDDDLPMAKAAMLKLAEVYEKGIGVKKDKKLAKEWADKAAAVK